jgi:hypothetical protein
MQQERATGGQTLDGKSKSEKLPVYVAEATCNASYHPVNSFQIVSRKNGAATRKSRDKSSLMATILLQERRITHTHSARAECRAVAGSINPQPAILLLLT